MAVYFNKLSFIRLLTIINHHKISTGVSKLYRPQGSGLRGKKGGVEVQGAGGWEVQRDDKGPGDLSSVCGRRLGQGNKAGICISETLSCVTFIRT